jgi:hypothetical protein
MMKKFTRTLMAIAIMIGAYGTAFGFSSYATSFKSTYPASPLSALSTVSGQAGNLCTVCHGTAGLPLNPYGSAYLASGFAAIELLDSDVDTFSNKIEIDAGTFPGNAASIPAGTDSIKPVVTAFAIPATSSSLVVPITTLTATDNVGVKGYKVTASAIAPLASSAGWTALKPARYTFLSDGLKTLYGWAKDAAGNVSLSMSDTVTITRTDKIKPTVTAFTVAASGTPRVANINSFTATDNVKVTGYKITETSKAPLAGANGWKAIAPTTYTSPTSGVKTLYGWAKDAAGNVSLARSAGGPITLGAAAVTATTNALNTAGLLLPAPASQQIFTYDPVEVPLRNADVSIARPVGITGVNDYISINVDIGRFAVPVDAYITLYSPSETTTEPVIVFTLKEDNTFEPLSNIKAPWRSNVTDINEKAIDMHVSTLLPGKYMLVFEVTPVERQDVYYHWITYFIVR